MGSGSPSALAYCPTAPGSKCSTLLISAEQSTRRSGPIDTEASTSSTNCFALFLLLNPSTNSDEFRDERSCYRDRGLPFGVTDRVDVDCWFPSSLGDRRFCETGPERHWRAVVESPWSAALCSGACASNGTSPSLYLSNLTNSVNPSPAQSASLARSTINYILFQQRRHAYPISADVYQ